MQDNITFFAKLTFCKKFKPRTWLIANGTPVESLSLGRTDHFDFLYNYLPPTRYISAITLVNFICYRWVIERNEIEIRLLWTAMARRSLWLLRLLNAGAVSPHPSTEQLTTRAPTLTTKKYGRNHGHINDAAVVSDCDENERGNRTVRLF